MSPEEILAARDTWKGFMKILVDHLKQGTACKSSLNPKEDFGDALIALERESSDDIFGMKHVLAEISQSFRHGYESLGGTICWMFFAISENPEVRLTLGNRYNPNSNPYPNPNS